MNLNILGEIYENIPEIPDDPIFGLTSAYRQDTFEKKVNVGVGAYRTNDGKPWVLPVVKKVEKMVVEDSSFDHEYLPIDGYPVFTQASAKLILGKNSPAITENRYCVAQSISGTGSLRLCAAFLARYFSTSSVYISNPTWINHRTIFKDSGMNVETYPYWDAADRGVDFKGLIGALESAPSRSIFVFHACAHNPTGNDPTIEQWEAIGNVVKSKGHITLFDSAYQGFASGDVDKDAQAVRILVSLGLELFVAQSYAKNFGLYNERTGALVHVGANTTQVEAVRSNLCAIQRAIVGNPPAFGSRIVAKILTDPTLYSEWQENLSTMVNRVKSMRQRLYELLIQQKTPGTWSHIIEQIGMFSYTGLTGAQSRSMKEKLHIYMTDNGRISIAGLNTMNVEYVAESMDWVVRNVQ